MAAAHDAPQLAAPVSDRALCEAQDYIQQHHVRHVTLATERLEDRGRKRQTSHQHDAILKASLKCGTFSKAASLARTPSMARLYQPGCYEEDVQAGEGAGERSTLAAPREPALATPSNAHPSPRASVEMSTDRASPKRLKAMALLDSPAKPPTLDPRGRVVLCAVMEAFLNRENQQELLPGSIGQHLRDTHHAGRSGIAESEVHYATDCGAAQSLRHDICRKPRG